MGLKFLRGIEEQRFAADAGIQAGLEQAAHLRAEGSLGAGFAGYLVLFGGQDPAPIRIGLFNPAIGRGVAVPGEAKDVGPLEHTMSF
jgi:hypothetical protein